MLEPIAVVTFPPVPKLASRSPGVAWAEPAVNASRPARTSAEAVVLPLTAACPC